MAGSQHRSANNADDSTSDFVKKLHKFVPFPFFFPRTYRGSLFVCIRMLKDLSFQNVVSWRLLGDCFVEKEVSVFLSSYPFLFICMFFHIGYERFHQVNIYSAKNVQALLVLLVYESRTYYS